MSFLKTYGTITLWLTLSYFTYGQEDINNFAFLKRDSNVFFFIKGNSLYDSLFLKFNELQINGNKQIRILHIGDSHVQADIFTNQIRRDFAQTFFYLIGPPAIAFPFDILKSNSPVTTIVRCNGDWFGYNAVSKPDYNSLLGLTACTKDTCPSKIMISVNKRAIQNVDFNKLLVFCNVNSQHVLLKTASASVHHVYLFNDTVFCHEFILNSYVDSITLFLKLHNDSSLFKLYGIIPMNDDPGIVYHSLGINGAKASSFNNTLLPYFIKYMHYDWVIISLGTNDCYASRFDSTGVSMSFSSLVNSIQHENPTVPIILTTSMEHYRKRKMLNANVVKMRDVLFNIAKQKHTAIWDLYTVSGGYKSMSLWYHYKLTAYDKLHLNAEGYHLVGDLFFEAFLNTYLDGFLAP
jgi:lysophospholipase L1-like esterase